MEGRDKNTRDKGVVGNALQWLIPDSCKRVLQLRSGEHWVIVMKGQEKVEKVEEVSKL
jgi:hypothetical protein